MKNFVLGLALVFGLVSQCLVAPANATQPTKVQLAGDLADYMDGIIATFLTGAACDAYLDTFSEELAEARAVHEGQQYPDPEIGDEIDRLENEDVARCSEISIPTIPQRPHGKLPPNRLRTGYQIHTMKITHHHTQTTSYCLANWETKTET